MGKKVLVLGSACVDVIIRVDHLPVTEENLHPSGQQFRVGGCAYNAANILGRGGAEVSFVTPVGLKGVFGPFLRPVLESQPWAHPVLLPEEENGCCYCLVEKNGERTFLSIHGVEYTFSPRWMAPYASQRFDYAYVCGLEAEEASGEALVSWLEGAAIDQLLYAPGPRGMKVPRERTERLLNLHPLLHLNEREACALGQADQAAQAARRLYARTGRPVIVTLGAAGALILDEQGEKRIPGEKVDRVADTIGAGDAHAGGVLLGLSRGQSLADAVALANRISAQVVRTEGATLSDEALKMAMRGE